ncbi:Sequestosome-1 [Phytophthora citrophthora]|uniref:Sequestosome-1 n=1 Tax=Phytophthora citrophthora TaxID=4793 RepID=A0AAD9GVQ5_9STRA|nr:Sequestosome-1 [Phytophthora citrophthora]
MEASVSAAESSSPVKPHVQSPRAIGEPTAAAMSPSTPTESYEAEVETEKSPVATKLEMHKPHEDGAESDKARTDSDDEEYTVDAVQEPTTPVEAPTTPVEAPSTPTDEPTTPVEQPPEQNFEDETVPVVAHEVELKMQSPPQSPVDSKDAGQVHEVELKVQEQVQEHEMELVIPSPKRPAPLNLVHHDIDDEASDSDEVDGAAASDDNDEGADLGTPLGYGGAADFGEGQDEFTSHRFLGPSVASDPSSARALHSIRRVALHDKPPRFVSEAPVVAASSGSVTSSGESSGRNSSSASAIHAPDAKSGLRSQSEADYVEHPLNTYTLTFTEQVLGFNTNVVVSLENELLVEVWSVDKDSPAQRGGVVVGDYLISVNGQHIEPHMTKEQVFEIIQSSTIPRTLVFQRDVHDKDGSQSKSLPDKKHSPGKPLMGRLGAAMSQGASIIGSKWKRKKTIVHQNSFCDGCGMDPIVGALWTCSVCSNYNLCSECYDLGTHGMENSEQMQALSEAIVQYKLQKKCKHFTDEFLLSLRRDICKGRPDKFEYLGEWIANIVVGTSAAKITVRGIEIPSLPPTARQRFVSYLMPLVSNRTDIEVNIEWLPDDADHINAAGRASVDRMSAGAFGSGDEEDHGVPPENLEKLRIWISDKKTRTTSPFA